MPGLDREQLQKAIERSTSGRFRVVDSDPVDESSEPEPDDAETAGLPSVTMDAIREKYERIFKAKPPTGASLTKSSQFVLVEPDDDVVSDLTTPIRRVAVVSEAGDVVAEQG